MHPRTTPTCIRFANLHSLRLALYHNTTIQRPCLLHTRDSRDSSIPRELPSIRFFTLQRLQTGSILISRQTFFRLFPLLVEGKSLLVSTKLNNFIVYVNRYLHKTLISNLILYSKKTNPGKNNKIYLHYNLNNF